MALSFEDVFLRVVAGDAELIGHSSIFVVFLLSRCSMDGLHIKIKYYHNVYGSAWSFERFLIWS